MTEGFKTGQAVTWRWGAGRAEGEIAEVHTSTVTRTIKGKRIRRKGSPEEPAYLVRQADGARALKSHSELDAA